MEGEQPKKKVKRDQEFIKKTVTFTILLGGFLVFNFTQGNNHKFYTNIKWLFLYLSGVVLSSFFTKYKVGKIIHSVMRFPAEIVLYLAPIIKSLSVIFLAYIGTICITMIV